MTPAMWHVVWKMFCGDTPTSPEVIVANSVVVLEESPCPRGSSRTNFQVLVLVLVLEAQVLVLVLVLERQVLVLVLGSSNPRKSSRTA